MRRKKKSGSKKQSLEKILLATAVLDLICQEMVKPPRIRGGGKKLELLQNIVVADIQENDELVALIKPDNPNVHVYAALE